MYKNKNASSRKCGKYSTRGNSSKYNKIVIGLRNSLSLNKNKIPQGEQLKECPDLSNLTIKEWYKLIKKNKIYTILKSNIESLHTRAQIISRHMIEDDYRKLKPIYLMDGHGRFVHILIDKLHKIGIPFSNFIQKINVIDNGNDCDTKDNFQHKFHEKIFPSGINSIDENILNMKMEKGSVVYLNFCGITSQINDVVKFINKNKNNYKIFISFSTNRKAHKTTQPLINYLSKGIGKIIDNCRENFVTYEIF